MKNYQYIRDIVLCILLLVIINYLDSLDNRLREISVDTDMINSSTYRLNE